MVFGKAVVQELEAKAKWEKLAEKALCMGNEPHYCEPSTEQQH